MALEKQHVTLAMPSPHTLRAPAVWITARSWALALAERFGEACVCSPDGDWEVDQLSGLIDSMLLGTSTIAPRRSRASLEARTFAKDLRLAARHLRGSQRVLEPLPRSTPPFVWQHHDPYFTLGSRLARSVEAPLVQFVDAPHVWEARRWGVRRPGWGRLLERTGEIPQLRRADLVVCVSEGVADAIVSLTGRAEGVIVSPCTADPTFFSDTTQRTAVREQLGLENHHVAVGWSGSFRRFHAVDQLIDAFGKVSAGDPNIRLILIGDGPDRERLEVRAASSPASEAITFSGQVPYSRMRDFVAAMDIAILTAREATTFHYSPLKLREYRASGRAIIAPAVGQITEALSHGEDGFLYEPGAIDDLASHISTLVADAALRERLGAASRAGEIARGGALAQVDSVVQELMHR